LTLLINILSDYKQGSLENAKLLAAIKSLDPLAQVICNKANFRTTDIIEPALYLILSANYYPANTIHIIDTKIAHNLPEKYLLAFCQEQWFVAPDNGLLNILMNNKPCSYFEIPTKLGELVSFTESILSSALWNITDAEFNQSKIQLKKAKIVVDSRLGGPIVKNNIYNLSILYFDENGDTYYDLHKDQFDKEIAGKEFNIRLSITQSISTISKHYSAVPEGETAALFHPSGFLYLANHHGSAKKLLGLKRDRKLMLQVRE